MASKYDVNTKETTASPEYSVLVVGYTGVGKSAFCNFLTRTKLFNEFEGFCPESSNEINKQCYEVLSTKLTIIDCPGFGDTEKTIEKYLTELETYLTQPHQNRISIDIIILVVNLAKRFSQEESELFLKMSKMMGYFQEKSFCVFTHVAYLEKNFKAKQTDNPSKAKFDYIELIKNNSKTSQELKELLNIVQDRYLCIETVDKAGDDEYWKANVIKLFEFFKEIKEKLVERGKKEREYEEIVKETESEGEINESKIQKKYNQLHKKYNQLQEKYNQLQEKYNQQQKENNQLREKCKQQENNDLII